MSTSSQRVTERITAWLDEDLLRPIEDFKNPRQEWRRLFSELLGTFFLVLVAAGGGMMGEAFPNTISRTAAVTAPDPPSCSNKLVPASAIGPAALVNATM